MPPRTRARYVRMRRVSRTEGIRRGKKKRLHVENTRQSRGKRALRSLYTLIAGYPSLSARIQNAGYLEHRAFFSVCKEVDHQAFLWYEDRSKPSGWKRSNSRTEKFKSLLLRVKVTSVDSHVSYIVHNTDFFYLILIELFIK